MLRYKDMELCNVIRLFVAKMVQECKVSKAPKGVEGCRLPNRKYLGKGKNV